MKRPTCNWARSSFGSRYAISSDSDECLGMRRERPGTFALPFAESVPIEIDIRGSRVDEIDAVLDRYIQDAYLMGLPWVRIIHGKGTGALRTGRARSPA